MHTYITQSIYSLANSTCLKTFSFVVFLRQMYETLLVEYSWCSAGQTPVDIPVQSNVILPENIGHFARAQDQCRMGQVWKSNRACVCKNPRL
jgi:hypothetical protein